MKPEPKTFFPGVHALRAVAALFVVHTHAGYMSQTFGDANAYGAVSLNGLGVILFFAISGFVIALNRSRPLLEFALHRVLRIYPTYWLAIIVAAIALASVGRHPSVSASMLLLYPSTISDDALTIPYWTLIFEITFYVLATAAFAMRLSDKTLTVISVSWIVAVNLFGANPADLTEYTFPGSAILLSPVVQVFPMGLIAGIHFKTFRRAGSFFYLALAVLCFALSYRFMFLSVPKALLLGITASCVVVALADIDLGSRFAMLGNASYGIYLMHFPAMMFVVLLAPGLSTLGIIYFFVVGLAAGVPFGLLDHRVYKWTTEAIRHRESKAIGTV